MNNESPEIDFTIATEALRLKMELERNPEVLDLEADYRISLGKKCFEFMDYRDKHRPGLSDEFIYCACLFSHGLERSRPDGIDIAMMNKKIRG